MNNEQKTQLIEAISTVIERGSDRPSVVTIDPMSQEIDWYPEAASKGIIICDRESIEAFIGDFAEWAAAKPREAAEMYVNSFERELTESIKKAWLDNAEVTEDTINRCALLTMEQGLGKIDDIYVSSEFEAEIDGENVTCVTIGTDTGDFDTLRRAFALFNIPFDFSPTQSDNSDNYFWTFRVID